jgi:hypothetical protein
LLRIDGDDSEWAGKSEDIALGQTISSDDCEGIPLSVGTEKEEDIADL